MHVFVEPFPLIVLVIIILVAIVLLIVIFFIIFYKLVAFVLKTLVFVLLFIVFIVVVHVLGSFAKRHRIVVSTGSKGQRIYSLLLKDIFVRIYFVFDGLLFDLVDILLQEDQVVVKHGNLLGLLDEDLVFRKDILLELSYLPLLLLQLLF